MTTINRLKLISASLLYVNIHKELTAFDINWTFIFSLNAIQNYLS